MAFCSSLMALQTFYPDFAMEKFDRTLKILVLFLRFFDRATIGYPKEKEPLPKMVLFALLRKSLWVLTN